MLTDEQQDVVDLVCSNKDDKIIAVNAVAGSGKTSTANAVINAYKPKNGFYTAFNKAIVEDSKNRFGKLIPCKTIHALAYKYIRPKKIEELTVLDIKEDLDYDDKALVIDLLDGFYRSVYLDIYDYLDSKDLYEQSYLIDIVPKYAEKMLNGELNPTFNFLLKCLHYKLYNKDITINNDLFIIDEAQDVTGVTLETFKLINADKKLILGDKFQNIYSFMDTVNAFEELDNLHTLKLTKSFRCNDEVANIVERFGIGHLDTNFLYKGNENINNTNNNTVYLSRTNVGLINRVIDLIEQNKTFTINKNTNEMFALPIAIINAVNNVPILDRRYKVIEEIKQVYDSTINSNSESFLDYLKYSLDNPVIASGVNAVKTLYKKRINIYALKKKVEDILNNNPNPNIILSTVHTFKGLEADTVYIENDLQSAMIKLANDISTNDELLSYNTIAETRKYLNKEQKELLNIYYVALSRARNNIVNNIYQ